MGVGKRNYYKLLRMETWFLLTKQIKFLSSKYFDSSPVLSATFVTFQNLQDIQNVATDTLGLIDDLELSLVNSMGTFILYNGSYVILDRKNLLQVID